MCDPVKGELTDSELLDDKLNFDIDNFNRVVLEEIANYIASKGAA